MNASKIVLKVLGSLLNILLVVLVIVGVLKIGSAAYSFGYRVYTEEPVDAPGNARNVQAYISGGMSALDIGKLLEERGLVDSAELFAIQLMVSDYKDTIKPGTYTLNTGQTAEEMMVVMSSETQSEEEK